MAMCWSCSSSEYDKSRWSQNVIPGINLWRQQALNYFNRSVCVSCWFGVCQSLAAITLFHTLRSVWCRLISCTPPLVCVMTTFSLRHSCRVSSSSCLCPCPRRWEMVRYSLTTPAVFAVRVCRDYSCPYPPPLPPSLRFLYPHLIVEFKRAFLVFLVVRSLFLFLSLFWCFWLSCRRSVKTTTTGMLFWSLGCLLLLQHFSRNSRFSRFPLVLCRTSRVRRS